MKNYVIGDIHGSLDSLKKAVDMIDIKTSRLFLIGDYVDRGKQSYEVMQYLMENCEPDYEKCGIHPILGNHDNTLLNNFNILKMVGDKINLESLKKISFFSPIFQAIEDIKYSLAIEDNEELLNISAPIINFISSLPVIYKVKSGEREFYLSHASLNGNSDNKAEDADIYLNKKCG
ncbi:MAG: metallophosphoesterase, partial [Firmicutes bacterium]|nr:metallophosphoesterase [Bacillota bacterium]